MANYLIDPETITNYDYTEHELQVFWLFCLVVAGKTAKVQARLLSDYLTKLPTIFSDLPFDKIRSAMIFPEMFDEYLKASRIGQYNRLSRAFQESVRLALRTCTVDDLEAIHGVGPKTARLFLMHSRPNVRHAAIDTHILKLLRENGYDVPKATPTGKKYKELEVAFLKLADESGLSPADFDLMTWRRFAR